MRDRMKRAARAAWTYARWAVMYAFLVAAASAALAVVGFAWVAAVVAPSRAEGDTVRTQLWRWGRRVVDEMDPDWH